MLSEMETDCSALTELSSELSSAPSSPLFQTSFPFNNAAQSAYPTPDSSQTQSGDSSGSECANRKRSRRIHNGDESTKAKRRRRDRESSQDEPKQGPKRPLFLNLKNRASNDETQDEQEIATLLKVLRKKRKIVVVAGAGISTSAGVPDFRSSNGLFNTLRQDNKIKGSGKQLFDASVYQTDSSTSSFHDMVRSLAQVVEGAKPTPFHHMLATLAHEGRLLRLYTQNVDGIDTSLPPLETQIPLPRKGPFPRTVQLHGSLKKMVCVKCRDLRDFEPHLFDGPNPPQCTSCINLDKVRTEEAGKRSHGIGRLRPRMVLYNEQNPDDEAIGCVVGSDLRSRPDAIVVVGTSMEIPGVKRIVREMCAAIRTRKDGKCVWLNRGPPPVAKEFEECWDLVVSGDCDQVAQLANMRQWNETSPESVRITDSEAENAKQSDIKVMIASPTKVIKRESQLPQRQATPVPLMLTPDSTPSGTAKIEVKNKTKSSNVESKFTFKKLSLQAQKPRQPKQARPSGQKKLQQGTSKPRPRKRLDAGLPKINTVLKVTKKRGLPQSNHALASKDVTLKEHQISHSLQESRSLSKQDQGSIIAITSTSDSNVNPEKTSWSRSSSPGRLRQLSEEIISPKGKVPNGMAGILA